MMAYVTIDKDGEEKLWTRKPTRVMECWSIIDDRSYMLRHLEKGLIKKLTGKDITWEDEPVEIK